MSIFAKIFYSGSLLFLASSAVSAGQEEVTTEGYGSGTTKVAACEAALDHARREAIQTASTIVKSNYQSTETNRGISARSDTFVTSKAFAKLVNKNETASFDADTGQISCKVVATFKAGFVNDDSNAENAPLTKSSKNVAAEFRSGEPVCSAILDACFREVYSKQLGQFGIQLVTDIHSRAKKFLFFNKVSGWQPDVAGRGFDGVQVKTVNEFLDFVKNKSDAACYECPAHIIVNGHQWNPNKGFYVHRQEASGITVIPPENNGDQK